MRVYLNGILFLLLFNKTHAQIVSAQLNIGGLTCSLCSSGVEKELRKLEFVEYVSMDLNTNAAKIIFKHNKEVMFNEIINGVKNAGFSVTNLSFNLRSDTLHIFNGRIIMYDHSVFFINQVKENYLKETMSFRIISKNTMTAKDYLKWKKQILPVSKDHYRNKDFYNITL